MITKDKSSGRDCHNCPAFKKSFVSVLSDQQLADLKDQSPTLVFRKGQKITTQQETAQGVYCIRSGIVKLFHETDQMTPATLGFRKAGNLIGHHGVMGGKNILSASCLTSVEACFFPRKPMLLKAYENPELLKKINTHLMEEMEEMITQLSNSYTKSIDQRLAEALLKLEEDFGSTEDGYVAMPLTRQELSQLIGASIESVFRSLAVFKSEKWIEVKKELVKINNKQALNALRKSPRKV